MQVLKLTVVALAAFLLISTPTTQALEELGSLKKRYKKADQPKCKPAGNMRTVSIVGT